MEEVLGLKTGPMAPAEAPEDAPIPLIVECEEVTEFTRPLLHTIMASVGVRQWAQIRLEEAAPKARHRIRFNGASGRRDQAGQVEWSLPRLSDMLGEGPDVAQRKKAAWTLLKEFQNEFKP